MPVILQYRIQYVLSDVSGVCGLELIRGIQIHFLKTDSLRPKYVLSLKILGLIAGCDVVIQEM